MGTDAARHINRETLAGVLIDHREAFQRLPVGAGIEDEVIGPHLIRATCRQRPGAARCHAAPRALFRHLQPGKAPEPATAVSAHDVPTTREEDLDAPVAVAGILGHARIVTPAWASRFAMRDS